MYWLLFRHKWRGKYQLGLQLAFELGRADKIQKITQFDWVVCFRQWMELLPASIQWTIHMLLGFHLFWHLVHVHSVLKLKCRRVRIPSRQGALKIPQVFLTFSHSAAMFLSPIPTSSGLLKNASSCRGHLGSTEEGHRAIAQWRGGEGKLDLNGAVHGAHFWFMIENHMCSRSLAMLHLAPTCHVSLICCDSHRVYVPIPDH